MPVVGKYVSDSDCEDQLSAEVWQRICDDDASGERDVSVGQRLVDNAESFVEARIGGSYSLTTLRSQGRVAVANEIKRLVLDVLTAYAIKRHPAYIRGDWPALLNVARQDLKELREGLAQLDSTTAPEPAANRRGYIRAGDPDETEPEDHVFLGPDKMGDF